MSNDFFNKTGNPQPNSAGSSSLMRAEIASIEAGFDKLPTITANGGKIIAVNAGATALEAVTTTGTGSAVRATSPTLVTPALGTPSALVGTNITGTAAGLTAGNVTTNANLTGHVTSVGNAAVLGSFTVAQLNTAVSDADVATIAGTETLTNKTLTSPVINTPTGIVKGDVGLGNVDNTSDANKPVSTAQATADGVVLSSAASDATSKANAAQAASTPIAHASNTSNPHSVTKAQVGLGSVDNTADTAKPVSTAQQTALNLKANIASPTFTGTVGGITAAMVGAPSGSGTSTGTNTGDQTNISGNAATATAILLQDTRAANDNPFAYLGASLHFKNTGTDGLSDGGSHYGQLKLTPYSDFSGQNSHELAFTVNNNVWHRNATGATTWGAWYKLYSTANFIAGTHYPSLTGSGASGTWSINTTGTAGLATTLSGDAANWDSLRSTAVANMLGWRNYGNGHVIFDASKSLSPTGSAVDNRDAANAWVAAYPTLMGWNGATTYGLRVDSARLADNATTAGGLVVSTGVNNVANQIVRTDANGYLATGYIHCTAGDEGNNGSPPRIWGTNGSDPYLRTYLTSALSVNYATTAGSATTLGGTQLNQSAHALTTMAANADWAKVAGYQTMVGAAGSTALPASHGQNYFGYTVTSKRDGYGGYSALLTAYDNSQMWFTYQGVSTDAPVWRKIWHDGNFVAGSQYQAPLVSGTSIKTINSTSLLGSGNIAVGDVTLAGVQTLTNKTLTGYTETVYNLAGTVIDVANGTVQTKTLAANTTFTESLADGQSVVLMLNPVTYTTTWPTTSWVNAAGSAAAPTLKASVVNVVVLWQVAGTLYGNWIGSM